MAEKINMPNTVNRPKLQRSHRRHQKTSFLLSSVQLSGEAAREKRKGGTQKVRGGGGLMERKMERPEMPSCHVSSVSFSGFGGGIWAWKALATGGLDGRVTQG